MKKRMDTPRVRHAVLVLFASLLVGVSAGHAADQTATAVGLSMCAGTMLLLRRLHP